jgi:hypothetical protein
MTPETTTGASIVGMILRDDVNFVALIPAEQMKLGALPDNIALPASLIRTISMNERQKLVRKGLTRMIDRVSVTVRASSYREQVRLIRLIREGCAGKVGDIGNGKNVSILAAGTGPDLRGPGDSFEQSQDFRVSYDA